jgi:hypothetical protein
MRVSYCKVASEQTAKWMIEQYHGRVQTTTRRELGKQGYMACSILTRADNCASTVFVCNGRKPQNKAVKDCRRWRKARSIGRSRRRFNASAAAVCN